MNVRHKKGRNVVRALTIALAILSVLFVAQALSHTHAKGQNEAACQICQAAHLGTAPPAVAALLSSSLIATGYVQPFVLALHQKLFVHDSPSRAPPSA
jgi:hypothetical protein